MADEKILRVMMAVTDMAKSKAFYTEKLGFRVTNEFGQGDHQWLTVEPPGGGTELTLTTMHGHTKPGTMALYLSTSNIEAVYQEFKARDVETTNEITKSGWGTWFGPISDPDGNTWQVLQS